MEVQGADGGGGRPAGGRQVGDHHDERGQQPDVGDAERRDGPGDNPSRGCTGEAGPPNGTTAAASATAGGRVGPWREAGRPMRRRPGLVGCHQSRTPPTIPAARATTWGGANPPASSNEISSTMARKTSRPTSDEVRGSPRRATATTMGARMPALIRRVASIGPSCAVPALALGELLDRGFQIGLDEVRPQGLGEDELGIGAARRKLLVRCSPPVRMIRSGSGWPAV